jgi:hypothetical protein
LSKGEKRDTSFFESKKNKNKHVEWLLKSKVFEHIDGVKVHYFRKIMGHFTKKNSCSKKNKNGPRKNIYVDETKTENVIYAL